jgi:hypothetical protein
MRNSKSNLSAVVEAKTEYTKLLMNYLKPLIYEAFVVLYSSSVDKSTTVESIQELFKIELQNIPRWNNEVVRVETVAGGLSDDRRTTYGCIFE